MEYLDEMKLNANTKTCLMKLVQAAKNSRGMTVPEMIVAGNWSSMSLFYQQMTLCVAHGWIIKSKPVKTTIYTACLDKIAISREEEQGRGVTDGTKQG